MISVENMSKEPSLIQPLKMPTPDLLTAVWVRFEYT